MKKNYFTIHKNKKPKKPKYSKPYTKQEYEKMDFITQYFIKQIEKLKGFVLVFTFAFIFIGCCTRKPIESHEIKTREKLEVINQPINDKLFISVPEVRTINKDCDSLAQDAVNRFASSIKSEKTSGSNSVKIGFDKAKNAVTIETKVGETRNSEITEVEKIKEVVVVKECHKIIKIFAFIGLLSVIFASYKVFRMFS